MKTIAIAMVLILGIAACCFGASDAVSSVTKKGNEETTTTFQRDGKTILRVIQYHSTEQDRRLLLQQVIFKDEVVMFLSDFQGKRAFWIRPNSNVSVGISQYLSTGALESVGLMDDSNGIIEAFDVKGSRLIPFSGERLELARRVTKDVGGLLAPESVKKSTPEEFGKRAVDLAEKYKKESENQQVKPSGDKPTSQKPSTTENK